MLAGITLDQATGVLTIDGSKGNDAALVSVASPNSIEVSLTGFGVQSFPKQQVNSIEFLGRTGDDNFRNDTSIPSVAAGHDGNDRLFGGSGIDV